LFVLSFLLFCLQLKLVDLVFCAVDHLVNNAGISGRPVTVENMRDVSEYTAVMVSREMVRDMI